MGHVETGAYVEQIVPREIYVLAVGRHLVLSRPWAVRGVGDVISGGQNQVCPPRSAWCRAPLVTPQLKSTPKKITATMMAATATGATNRMKNRHTP